MFHFSPNNKIITITRGDSGLLNFTVEFGRNLFPIKYELKDNDALYFAVMEANQPFENAIIRKKVTKDDTDCNGNVIIKFNSCDTEFLSTGQYYYEIKLLHYINGEAIIDTIQNKKIFNII